MKKYLVFVVTTIIVNCELWAMPKYYSFPEQVKIADVVVEVRILVSNGIPYANVLNAYRGSPHEIFPIIKIDRDRFVHMDWEEYIRYDKVLVFLKETITHEYQAIGVNDICIWPKFIESFPYRGMITSYEEVIRNYLFFDALLHDMDFDRKLKKVLFATKFSKPFTKIAISQYLSFSENNNIALAVSRDFHSLKIAKIDSYDLPLKRRLAVCESLMSPQKDAMYEFLFNEWCELDYITTDNHINKLELEKYMNYIDSRIQFYGCGFFSFLAMKYIQNPNSLELMHFWNYLTKTDTIHNFSPWKGDTIEMIVNGGREQARARTELLLNEYHLADKEKREQDKVNAERSIRAMGIFAWATIAEEAKRGDELAIRIFKDIFYKQLPNYEDISVCLEWWEENKERYTLPPQRPDFKGDYGLDKWKRMGR